MTTQELEVAIREIINRSYCVQYCGCIQVNELLDKCCFKPCTDTNDTDYPVVGYEAVIGLNNIDKPIRIAYYGDQLGFLGFLADDIQKRRLDKIKFFKKYTAPDPNEQY